MKPKFCLRIHPYVLPLAIALTCGGSAVADNAWIGDGSSTNWSDAGNWTGGAITGAYFGTLTFTSGGTQGTTSIDDVSGANGNMLLWTGSDAWTLNGSNTIALYDNGGAQAKIENQSTGLVTINAPITFAANNVSPTNPFGEINAVSSDITFGSGTLTVNGSSVYGLKFWGGTGRTVTFNNTVSATGKWLATTGAANITIGSTGSVTAADVFVMNGGSLNLAGTLTHDATKGVRLGGDFGTTGNQDLTKGGTFNLTPTAGGLTYSGIINSVASNTSGALAVNSQNTSGTNTLSGAIYLDSSLAISQAAGGTLALTTGGIDLKGNTLTLTSNTGSNINATGAIINTTGSGNLIKSGAGTLTLSGANTFTGKTTVNGGVLSISSDAKLGTAPIAAVADQLTLNGGTLKITAASQTLSANRGITLGASGGTLDTSALANTSTNSTTVAGAITGTGALTLKSNGDLSASGGGSDTIGTYLTNAGSNFTGDITVTSGLVTYASNAVFGNTSNKIILNGGGLLDNNTSIALPRNIQIGASGGTFRAWGSSNVTWSGAITGSGNINRTDGGTITHSGDLSGFGGTYNVQAGTTQLTGTATTIGGNWTVATGTNLTINSTAAQSIAGSISGTGNLNINSTATLALNNSISMAGGVAIVNGLASAGSGSSINMGTGTFRVNGTGIATIGSGATLNSDVIAFTGTTSNQLNILTGATVTTKYLNIGDAGNNSGRIVQSGGTVTVAAGGTGMRIGHWNNGSNAGSLYNLSGGTLNASAIAVTIGHDGQGDMIVGGGLGSALFQASSIQLDANGDGGGNAGGNMTLTLSSNGTVEVGTGGIGAAAAGDRVILNGGTMKAVGTATWGSVFNANTSTSSTLNTNGNTVTLSNNITGTGTINLSSATGGVTFTTTGTQTVTAGLDGSTAISKTGTGTTTLSGTGTHSGTITVNDGRLNLSGTTGSSISVAANKSLGGEGSTTGALTLNGTNNFFIDPASAGKLTVGNLTLTGTNTLKFETPPTAGSVINVITYTGSKSGAFGTNLVVENAAKYRSTNFNDTAGVVTLDLGTKSLTWNGTTGGQWDLKTSARWNASEVDQFAWGDSVTFDDNGVATTVTLTGELQPSSLAVSGTKNYSLNGGSGNFISGLTGLAKSGASTLVLNAPNTFSGATTITGGTVQIGDGTNNTAALGTSAASVASGSSLVFFRNGAVTISNSISGAGTLAFRGTGVSTQSDYTLTGTNSSFTGTFDIRNGARVLIDNTADAGTSSIVVNSGGQLWLGNTTITNNISLAGSGWTEATGQLGAVRFSGGTISGGVTLTGNSRLTAWGADTGTVSGVITDGASSFGITKTGTGTLTLTNANTYDGGTTLSFGGVNIRNASSLGTGAVTIGDTSSSTNAISLYLDTNRISFGNAITVSANGTGTATLGSLASVASSGDNNQFTNITLQRDVTFDSNALDRTDYENVSGTGNITVSGAGRTVFAVANSYVGNLTIRTTADANGLQLGTNSAAFNALYDSGSVQIDSGGKLSLSYTAGGSETIGALTGAGTVRNNGGASNTIIVGNGNGSGTFSGTIVNGGGTIGFTKTGTGTQTLTGANTYTGATTLSRGTLALDFSATGAPATNILNNAANTSALTMSGGTLALTGKASTTNSQRINGLTINGGTNIIQLSANATANPLVLTLGGITRTAGTVDFILPTGTQSATNGITTTSSNDATGILGTWATVGGTDFAAVSSGNIVAYAGYVNVDARAGGTNSTINNSSTSNVRINGDGVSGAIGLGSATTTINTLLMSHSTVASTVDTSGKTLALSTILAGSGKQALILGSAAGDGFLQTSTAGGTLLLDSESSNGLTVNAVINNNTSASALTKTGAGLLTLAAANTYTGTTSLMAGTVKVTNTAGLGAAGNAVSLLGGTLQLATDSAISSKNLSVGGQVAIVLDRATAGAGFSTSFGNLTFNDNYNLSVTKGANVTSGTATLNFTGFPALGSAGKTAGFDVGTGVEVNISGSLTGTQAFAQVQKLGAGTLVLSGNNNYWDPAANTGLITVSAGTLDLRSQNAMGDGLSGATSIGLSMAASTTLRVATDTVLGNNATTTLTGTGVTIISDRATAGAGLTNQFNNLIVNGAYTLNVTGGSNISSGITQVNFNAATLGGNTTLNVANPAAGSTALLISGIVSESGGTRSLTKTGTGTLLLTNAANAYSGGTTLSDGILAFNSGSLGSSGTITMNGGTLRWNGTNTQDVSSRLAMVAAATATFDTNGNNVTFASAFGSSAAGLLTKAGTGTLTLAGANTFTGKTNITAGTLSISADNNLGTAPGAATAGHLIINGGTLAVTSGFTMATNRGISVGPTTGSGTGTIDVASGQTLTYGGVVANNGGTGALTKAGAGTLVLTGAGTWTGTGTVSAGTLEVQAKSTDVAYSVAQGATLKIGYSSGGGYSPGMTLNGNGVSDAAGLYLKRGVTYQTNGGILIQTAPTTIRTYGTGGNAAIQGFDVNSAYFLKTTSAASGSVVDSTINVYTGSYGYRLQADSGSNNASGDLTINGVISGGGSAQVSGEGIATGLHKFGTGSLKLTAASTYSAGTSISDGSVILAGGDNSLPVGTTVALGNGSASGKLVLGDSSASANQTVAGLLVNGSGTSNAVVGGNSSVSTLSIANSTSVTYSGKLGGTGTNENNLGLNKSGSGTLFLTGTNTYSGDTAVNAGILRVNGTNSGTGLVSVASGATLGGTGSIAGAVNVSGVLSPGASIQSLATGSLSMAGGSSLEFELQDASSTGADLVDITGDFSLSGLVTLNLQKIGTGTWSISDKLTLLSYTGSWNNGLFTYSGNTVADDANFTFDGQLWTLNYNDTTAGTNFTSETSGSFVTMTAIPEPRAALIGGLGLLALLRRRRVS